MATIVEDSTTGQRLVLLGAGFGMYSSSHGHVMWGNLAPERKEGSKSLVCVADESGAVGWIDSQNVRVVSVDGQSPTRLLQPSDG